MGSPRPARRLRCRPFVADAVPAGARCSCRCAVWPSAGVDLIAYAAALTQMHVSICAPSALGGYVARVVIDVMLKPEIHDPQGDAIAESAHRLGYSGVVSVRQGKRFEVEISGPVGEPELEAMAKLASDLLANPVIEEFTLHAG